MRASRREEEPSCNGRTDGCMSFPGMELTEGGKCRIVTPPTCAAPAVARPPTGLGLLSLGVAQQWPWDRGPLNDKAEAQGQTTGLQTISFLGLLISDGWKGPSPQYTYTKNKPEIDHPQLSSYIANISRYLLSIYYVPVIAVGNI